MTRNRAGRKEDRGAGGNVCGVTHVFVILTVVMVSQVCKYTETSNVAL